MSGDEQAKNVFNNSHVDNFIFTCPKLKLTGFRAVDVVLPGFAIGVNDLQTQNIIEKLPGASWNPDHLVITWLMNETWSTYIEIFKWILEIKNSDELDLDKQISNASVVITDNHLPGKGVVSFRYENFFPVGINSISLSSISGVASPVYGVATFAMSNIIMDEINGFEYEDIENLVRG